MNSRLIRTAIAFYPREWRRRYGGELEELVLESCDASASRVRTLFLIVGVAACGIRERIPRPIAARATRTTVTLAAVGLASLAVATISHLDRTRTATVSAPSTPITLAHGLLRGHAIKEIHSGAMPGSRGSGKVVVSVDRSSGDVLAVGGGPVRATIDPTTGQLVAVARRSH
jgi:hypothetical protein